MKSGFVVIGDPFGSMNFTSLGWVKSSGLAAFLNAFAGVIFLAFGAGINTGRLSLTTGLIVGIIIFLIGITLCDVMDCILCVGLPTGIGCGFLLIIVFIILMDYLPGRKFEELPHTTIAIDLYTIKIKYLTYRENKYEIDVGRYEIQARNIYSFNEPPYTKYNYLEDDGEYPVIVLYCSGTMCWCMNRDYWWVLLSYNHRIAIYPDRPIINPNVTKRTIGDRDAVFNLIGDLC